MPLGSYEISDAQALATAYRLVKEGGADAVKLEGWRPRTVARLVQGGVPVVGHIGLTPQACATLGGFRAQGRSAAQAAALVAQVWGSSRCEPTHPLFFFKGTPRNTYSPAHFLCVRKARDVERAGAFCVVVECVPSVVGRAITEALQVPTVGIGAGPWMAGQVLVFHDLVGMSFHSDQHEAFAPRFCKRYASVGDEIVLGLRDFVREVKSFFCSIR